MPKENDAQIGELRTLSERLGMPVPDTSSMSSQQMDEALQQLRQLDQSRTDEPSLQPLSQEAVLDDADNQRKLQIAAESQGKTVGGEGAKQQAPYTVAPGKSVIAKSGDMLDAGAAISAEQLADGDKALEQLVKAGYVVKTGDQQQQQGQQAITADGTPDAMPGHTEQQDVTPKTPGQ